MIDKFADRGLRSLAVAYQVPYLVILYWFYDLLKSVCALLNIFISGLCSILLYRKFLMEGKRAWEVYGNLLASCLSSTHLDMTVQIQ